MNFQPRGMANVCPGSGLQDGGAQVKILIGREGAIEIKNTIRENKRIVFRIGCLLRANRQPGSRQDIIPGCIYRLAVCHYPHICGCGISGV